MPYRTFIEFMRNKHEFLFRIMSGQRNEQFVIFRTRASSHRRFFPAGPCFHYSVMPVLGSDGAHSVEPCVSGHDDIGATYPLKGCLRLQILDHYAFVHCTENLTVFPAVPFGVRGIL